MIMYAKAVGGAELQFIELANYLARSHSVRLICLGGDGSIKASRLNEALDVRVYSYYSRTEFIYRFLKCIRDNIDYSAEAIVTTSFVGDVCGYVFRLFGIKAKLTSLQTVSACMLYPAIDRFVLRRFDKLIAGANDIKEYLLDHGQRDSNIHVVHNWVDFSHRLSTKNSEETKKKFGIPSGIIIGCIGRLHQQKGQIYLIRAFAKVLQHHQGLVLLLIGDGPTRHNLEEEAHKLDLSRKIIFTGTASGDDYNNLLSAIDIYVQPSVFEGLPRTLLDAMYIKRPVIATNINGNKEAVQDGVSGLLVESKSPDALALAITDLLDHSDKAEMLGQNAKDLVIRRFDMNQQLKKIESIVIDSPSNADN